MCRDKVLWWLSGAAGLDAAVHLISGLGWNWFGVSRTSNLVLFVVFALVAIALGYMANCYSRAALKPVKQKKK